MFFENQPFSCHNELADNQTAYCPAIQQLLAEHEPLRKQMRLLIDKAGYIINNTSEDKESIFQELFTIEQTFKQELNAHSDKEESGLFVLLKQEMGPDFGPVTVMEYEHDNAKKHLSLFEQLASAKEKNIEEAATYIMEACQILLIHFNKEERILFPLSEQVLSSEQKEKLFQIVHQ